MRGKRNRATPAGVILQEFSQERYEGKERQIVVYVAGNMTVREQPASRDETRPPEGRKGSSVKTCTIPRKEG